MSGSGGTAGSSGSGGAAGASGTGGTAGASGSAGTAGVGGTGATGGVSGTGGGGGAGGSCIPKTCDDLNVNCGDFSNGCESTLHCGNCESKPGLTCGILPEWPNICGCTPESYTCIGDQLRRCDSRGAGTYLVADCASGACNAGGQCDTCIPGSDYCSGTQLMTCNANGQGGVAKGSSCLVSQFCDPKAGGSCDICEENGYFCVGANLRQCNGSGSGSFIVATCGSSASCQMATFLGFCPPL